MNPRTAELIRMNGYKFNLLLGFVSIALVPLFSELDLRAPGFVIGFFGLMVYLGEAWAFYYKTKLMRVRIVYDRTQGDAEKIIAPLPKLGCFVSYGFMIRLVFRVLFLVIALSGFGLMSAAGQEKINGVAMTLLIPGVLFELFLLMVSWLGSRLETDDKEKDPRKAEQEWRMKNFPMLNDPKLYLKEAGADLLLFISAMMCTHLFWTMSNNNMMESIDQSVKDGGSALGSFLTIFICNFILCLFMLVPVRLAYWIGESISVIDTKNKWKLRLSILFAGISITLPVFVHWYRAFF